MLTSAELTGADLSEVKLCEAFLRHANLANARLTGADFYEADLLQANLRPAYPNASISTWASIYYNKAVSNQVFDHRLFTGIWPYLVIATWGNAIDLVVNRYTRSHQGVLEIVAAIYCDVSVRLPVAFAFTERVTPLPYAWRKAA